MSQHSEKPMLRPKIQVGLIGADIQMSKSPALHEREAGLHGLDYHYELIDLTVRGVSPDHLEDLLLEVERRGFAGVNITHPCKQLVIPHLHELSEDAATLGAVNTVVLRNGKRFGHNTDWSGFYENFARGLPDVTKRHAVLLGAGGAGVAVAHAALKLGIERLSISDRDTHRAEELAAQLNDRFGSVRALAISDVASAMKDADGLIHATPTGMRSHPGLPIDPDLLDARHWVADIVYMPLVTSLLKLARERGCCTLDGGGMTVFQAVGAIRLFSGIEPDPERMRRHFAEIIASEDARQHNV